MLTRRLFLKAGGVGGVALFTLGAGPQFLTRTALAAQGRRKVLVTIFQRGAMDGLMAVSPVDDTLLAAARPRLRMSAARRAGEQRLIDLDGGFALHPSFGALERWYREGRLGIVHGVGSPDPTRSHFDAQDYMETGTPGRKGTSSGWLNRALGLLGHEATPFQGVSLTPALPRSLQGDASAIAISSLEDFRVQGTAGGGQGALEELYEQTTQGMLRGAARETFEAERTLRALDLERYRPAAGADYPRSPLGESLRQIAQLIKADVGLEVAFAESAGWDTHAGQGTLDGSFARRARDLAASISAFWTDLEGMHDRVTLMTMTEFGRTVRENGSGGTDHGRASCLFVLGDEVDGGKVHGRLPELAPENLEDGRDVPVTTDFRAVFSEVAGRHLGVGDDAALFPGWQGGRIRLLR